MRVCAYVNVDTYNACSGQLELIHGPPTPPSIVPSIRQESNLFQSVPATLSSRSEIVCHTPHTTDRVRRFPWGAQQHRGKMCVCVRCVYESICSVILMMLAGIYCGPVLIQEIRYQSKWGRRIPVVCVRWHTQLRWADCGWHSMCMVY